MLISITDDSGNRHVGTLTVADGIVIDTTQGLRFMIGWAVDTVIGYAKAQHWKVHQ